MPSCQKAIMHYHLLANATKQTTPVNSAFVDASDSININRLCTSLVIRLWNQQIFKSRITGLDHNTDHTAQNEDQSLR